MQISSYRKHAECLSINLYRARKSLRIHSRQRAVWIVETHLSLHDRNCYKGAIDRFFRVLLPVRTKGDLDDRPQEGSSPPQLTVTRLHRWLVNVLLLR